MRVSSPGASLMAKPLEGPHNSGLTVQPVLHSLSSFPVVIPVFIQVTEGLEQGILVKLYLTVYPFPSIQAEKAFLNVFFVSASAASAPA